MQRRGIYFLANDRLFEPVVAFLNSLRAHNPEIPLCLIPYDKNTSRIQALASRYNFSTLDDGVLLSRCDAISILFHNRIRGHYRKIAAWSGIFDEFLYIDIDTVVLKSVDIVFPLLGQYDVVTAHSNVPESRMFVWKDSIRSNSELTASEIDYAANTGFILSKLGLFAESGIDSLVKRAKELTPHMELECVEQPLLNYLIVKSTHQYTSLRRLNEQSSTGKLPEECWAGDVGWEIENSGICRYRGRASDVLFVHWSGVMVPRKWERRLFSVLGRFGFNPPSMRLHLKQGLLWRYYRNLNQPNESRAAGYASTGRR